MNDISNNIEIYDCIEVIILDENNNIKCQQDIIPKLIDANDAYLLDIIKRR